MRSVHTDDLRLAHVLADDADSLTMDRFKSLDLHVATKPDLSPVTDADQAAEEAVRRTLSRARPRDAVLGEEQGTSGWGPRRWVIDPIDGTKNFMRGVPVWATLIALMIEDEVVVGCVSAPALGRRWWAAAGDGAWVGRSLMNAQPCRVSDVSSLDDASLSYSSLSGWEHCDRLEDFLALSRRCWRTRAYGDFWSHVLVAEGAVDVAVEPELELYDMAALAVVVTEAGGQFSSLDGTPGPSGGNGLATNANLHEQVLGFIGALPPDEQDARGTAGARGHPRDDRGQVHTLASRRRPEPRD